MKCTICGDKRTAYDVVNKQTGEKVAELCEICKQDMPVERMLRNTRQYYQELGRKAGK